MKSYTLRILLIITSLTVVGCMPDSLTKFKEDPPKKASVQTSGGTVVVVPADLYPGTSLLCSGGNGNQTIEDAAENLVGEADLTIPFTSSSTFLVSPFTDGSSSFGSGAVLDNPNHEFVVLGNGATNITDLSGAEGVTCFIADDATTTEFNNPVLIESLTLTLTPDPPTGLNFSEELGTVTGTMTGFNELAAYTLTATNNVTGTVGTHQFELASSTPLNDASSNSYSYYTQINATDWAIEVDDAGPFFPNYKIVNQKGAEAVINFIDKLQNILYVTISTTAGEEFDKNFSDGDEIDIALPTGAATFSSKQAGIVKTHATLLTGVDIAGGADNFALRFKEESGLVTTDTLGTYDGITPDDAELTEWARCTHAPDISGVGTIDFLDGVLAATADPLTTISSATNWGLDGTNVAVDDAATATLNRVCEFAGTITEPLNYRKITTTMYSYAGETSSASFGIQARTGIAQPFPVTNTYSTNDAVDRAFYFHYRYRGTGTDKATMIITVENSANYRYNSTTFDENMISNFRGTSARITAIDGNKLYVTLENNDSFAFVIGDEVDNTGSYLSPETAITDIEYTFQVGFTPAAGSYFEPQLALLRTADRLDVTTATTLAPTGTSEFSDAFLDQIKIGGSISILNNSGVIETATISSVTLTPGNHSITTTAFGSVAGRVNALAYLQPHSTAERLLMSYSINNYIGQATAAVCTGPSTCSTNDFALLGSLASREVSFKSGAAASDAEHGRISVDNVLLSAASTQSFVISAVDIEGNSATTNFKFSVSEPPSGLTMNRNLLLSTPSGSAFKVGSYISSNNADPGLGIVKDVISDKYSTYDMIDIKLISGSFEDDDDIDNRQTFDSQKTYIFSNGVVPYNAALFSTALAGATTFQDRYSCAIKSNRKFTDSAAASYAAATTRGVVAYAWDNQTAGNDSILTPGIESKVFLQVEKGGLQVLPAGIQLLPMDCAGALGAAITFEEIIADNLKLGTDATTLNTGLNITSDNAGAGAGSPIAAGVIHFEDDPNNIVYVGQHYFALNKIFLVGAGTNTLDNVNPFVAGEAASDIDSADLDHTFYLYRNEAASIQLNLEAGIDDNTQIEFLDYNGAGYCKDFATIPSTHTTRTACLADTGTWVLTDQASFPAGLTADTSNGRISGTPTINADKEKFLVRVSTPYGSVEHEFELKVYDHFIVKPTDTAAKPKPDSYLMHQIGYGMANVPCRVTQEAMDSANPDVVDITCLMDGGESDLFYKGLDLTIRTGDDMCSAVQHTPFYYYDWEYILTTNTTAPVIQYTGDRDSASCSSQPELSFEIVASGNYSTSIAGVASTPTATDAATVGLGLTAPADICKAENVGYCVDVNTNLDCAGCAGGGGTCNSCVTEASCKPGGDDNIWVRTGSDYNTNAFNPPGPNCDEGAVTVREVNLTNVPFQCLDGTGNPTTQTTFGDCYENIGSCTDSGGLCTACETAGDCTTCLSRTDCHTSEAVGSWVFDGSHNQDGSTGLAICNTDANARVGGQDCSNIAPGSNTSPFDNGYFGCLVDSVATIDDVECGGNQGACIGGAGSVNQGLSEDDLEVRTIIASPMINSTQVDISYSSPQSQGNSTNLFIANYVNRTTCEDASTYDFSFSDGTANNNVDWNDYADQDPTSTSVSHPFAGGHNTYEYSCDGGTGTTARVRMFVRDIDNSFNVTDGIEQIALGVYGVDNTMDDPGDTCGVFLPCNNRNDWDDYVDSVDANLTCGNTGLLFDFNGSDLRYPREKR